MFSATKIFFGKIARVFNRCSLVEFARKIFLLFIALPMLAVPAEGTIGCEC
jgi:hypothetical protein